MLMKSQSWVEVLVMVQTSSNFIQISSPSLDCSASMRHNTCWFDWEISSQRMRKSWITFGHEEKLFACMNLTSSSPIESFQMFLG